MREVLLLFGVAVLCLNTAGCDSNEVREIQVVRYRGETILPSMVDKWDAEIEFGVATLRRYYSQDSTVAETLVLIDDGEVLPAYGGYSFRLRNWSSPRTLFEGAVEISSFDVNGEISGRVSGELWQGGGVRVGSTFWVDLE